MTRFLDLHRPGRPLLAPNPWDLGSARILASVGFQALATTSSGLATALGVLDGAVDPETTLRHARAIGAATGLPVTVDLEDGHAAAPEGVAETIAAARDLGLAGASIEDWDGARFYPVDEAAARVAAAARAAGAELVLTARADNFFHGVTDLGDTIARLQAFEQAGAHVLYAPGLERLDEIRAVIAAVRAPVNVLLRPSGPTVAELAAAGAARITVGGAFAFAAFGTLAELAQTLLDDGTGGDGRLSAVGRRAAQAALGP
jgi:2-methylisocitrate lyase-like PEP mutase family enzyme